MKSITFLFIICIFSSFHIQAQAQEQEQEQEQEQVDNDSLLTLIIKMQKDLDTIKLDKPDKQVMFSVGGNLNFLSNLKVEGLYYDVSTYFPSLDTTKFWKNVGLGGRLAQGRFLAAKDSFRLRNAQILNFDSTQVIDQDYNYRTTETISYLSISMTPTIKLGKRSPFYLAAHFEFLRSTRLLNIETIVTRQDTIDHTFNPETEYIRTPIKTENRSLEIVDYNMLPALGIKFFHKYKKINIDITALFGKGGNFKRSRGWEWNDFYLTRFEVHYTGTGSFKLGGEIRGYFNDIPFSTVYIAKTFSFQTLASLFK